MIVQGNPCTRCGSTDRYSGRDGCVSCIKAGSAAWYQANKDRKRATEAAWVEANRDRKNGINRGYQRRKRLPQIHHEMLVNSGLMIEDHQDKETISGAIPD
jgi:hypothetical protein